MGIIWQQQKSLLLVGAFLTGAMIVLSLHIRPYGLLFSILLAFWLYKTRCPNFKLITPPTITNYGENLYHDYLEFRRRQPRLCWMYTSSVLVGVAVLGHIVSGKTIIVFGLLMATLIFSKHKLTIVKVQQDDEKIWSSQTTDLDEFLPDVNESNLSLLQHAGEEAVILHSISSPLNDDDEKSDELPSDLIIPDALPEIDEQTDSSDDECLISPAAASQSQKSSTNEEMEFNVRYFKDTSSSDDDSISKGLSFKDYNVVDGATQRLNKSKTETVSAVSQRSSMFSIPSMMADLMTNLTKSSRNESDVDKSRDLPKGPDKSNECVKLKIKMKINLKF
ncbi:hypothetical protein Bhyg_11317 [Pseudolycoriella hygida]|uniref:Protein with signal anchor n=1 Tax=Pseudolycoriella hygida TaxID=35572 RepID=A0A9Q0RY86_9DIPT|nr:hypothetical protein Bhyg_11317 [Pseudolycoriella hygida]